MGTTPGTTAGDQHAGVAAALMQALEQHPGGIGGILDCLRQNGMADHVQNWASGQQASTAPGQVQQCLSGTGLIESAAKRAGVSPEIATAAVTALLPTLIQHFAPGGQAAPQSSMGSLAQEFLGKIMGNKQAPPSAA